MRKRIVLTLAAALIAAMMAAGPALADPGGNPTKSRGIGQGIGGGQANLDNGQHTATGDGTLNNPHLGF